MSAAYMRASDAESLTRAEHHALRRYLADLPDPEHYARILPLNVVEALMRVSRNRGWQAYNEDDAVLLRPWGLCECGRNKRGMSVFGMHVIRALLEEMT